MQTITPTLVIFMYIVWLLTHSLLMEYIYSIHLVCMYASLCLNMYVEVRGQFLGVDFLLPPCVSHGTNWGLQAWQQAVLPTEKSTALTVNCFKLVYKVRGGLYCGVFTNVCHYASFLFIPSPHCFLYPLC